MNRSLIQEIMPLQDSHQRIQNFDEVALGYTAHQAILEANRCLECKTKPCVSGCPVAIDIPAFIHEIKASRFEEAYQIIEKSSLLPAVCGRVCPQETQCEAPCVRKIKGESVAIGRLERFVSDYHFKNSNKPLEKAITNGIKIAVVGSGPAGLSCAYDLAKLGYQVTLFEALHMLGGVLVYGIPEFRLPRFVVNQEIDKLVQLGVDIKKNIVIGKTLTIDDLFNEGYQSVFLGTGAGLPKFLGIPGEMLNGVYTANEFLTRINLMKAYKNDAQTPIMMPKTVAVIGGGNVAMDAARCAKRLGAKTVYVIYRRSKAELPARHEEVIHAEEEGIIFKMLTNPKEIIGNDSHFVASIRCSHMTLGEVDYTGRRKPVEIKGTEEIILTDAVILALGTTPNPLIKMTTKGLESDTYGCIITKDTFGMTTKDMVYAGGDVVTGSATVISAMGAGRLSAQAIHERLKQKNGNLT
jgi:glutamate synthase (NADPH) small chain